MAIQFQSNTTEFFPIFFSSSEKMLSLPQYWILLPVDSQYAWDLSTSHHVDMLLPDLGSDTRTGLPPHQPVLWATPGLPHSMPSHVYPKLYCALTALGLNFFRRRSLTFYFLVKMK